MHTVTIQFKQNKNIMQNNYQLINQNRRRQHPCP